MLDTKEISLGSNLASHSCTSLPRTGELVDLAHPGPGGNGKCDLADHLERAEETVSEATRIYIYNITHVLYILYNNVNNNKNK